MKINFKLADIEITIEDGKETDRSKLLGDGLGCIESMLNSRLSMYGSCSEDEEEEGNLSGQKPAGTELKIIPDVAMQHIYG